MVDWAKMMVVQQQSQGSFRPIVGSIFFQHMIQPPTARDWDVSSLDLIDVPDQRTLAIAHAIDKLSSTCRAMNPCLVGIRRPLPSGLLATTVGGGLPLRVEQESKRLSIISRPDFRLSQRQKFRQYSPPKFLAVRCRPGES